MNLAIAFLEFVVDHWRDCRQAITGAGGTIWSDFTACVQLWKKRRADRIEQAAFEEGYRMER